jgi:hypothetical protein
VLQLHGTTLNPFLVVFNVDAVVKHAVKQGERPNKGMPPPENLKSLSYLPIPLSPLTPSPPAILDQEARLQKLIAAKVSPLCPLLNHLQHHRSSISDTTMPPVCAKKLQVTALFPPTDTSANAASAAKAARARDTAAKARASSEQYNAPLPPT